MSRRAAARVTGARVAKFLEERADEAAYDLVRAGGVSLSVLRALRSHLPPAIADAVEASREVANPSVWDTVRSAGHRTANIAASVRAALRRQRRPTREAVLVFPQTDGHLHNLIPVAVELERTRDVTPIWILARARHVRWPDSLGQSSLLVYQPRTIASSVFRARELAGRGRRLIEAARARSPLEGIARRDWEIALSAASRLLSGSMTHMVEVANALERAISEHRPAVLLTGNPSTLEGRIACAVGATHGVPSTSLQHGDILPGDMSWRDLHVDLMCVWGDRSRDALLACGIAPAVLEITGAAPLDALALAPRVRRGDASHTVLVALSGAGHLFGLPEHLAIVDRVWRAAAATADLRWTFRLHPKDDRRHYDAMAERVPAPNATIVESRATTTTIHDQLAGASLLVTVVSTAALDAMVHGVPVLTLDRAASEVVPEYVRLGATTRVGPDEDLVTRTRALLQEGQQADIAHTSSAYVQSFYGPLDGQATARIVAAVSRRFGIGEPRDDEPRIGAG